MNSENIFSVSLFFFSRTMDLEHFPIMSNYAEYLCSDQWGGTWTKLVDQSVFRKPFFCLSVLSKHFLPRVWMSEHKEHNKKTRSVHCKFPEVFILEHVLFLKSPPGDMDVWLRLKLINFVCRDHARLSNIVFANSWFVWVCDCDIPQKLGKRKVD